jgi:hypothetical protein
MLCGLNLDNLDTSISLKCEIEFQRQANKYDGELFCYVDSFFGDIDLKKPSVSAQVILGCFANSGCPINGLRFGASLYPYSFLGWPVQSNAAALNYLFSSIETLLNVRHDLRIQPIINKFESSNEHKMLLHTIDCIIDENRLTTRICPEIQLYIRDSLLRVPSKHIQ